MSLQAKFGIDPTAYARRINIMPEVCPGYALATQGCGPNPNGWCDVALSVSNGQIRISMRWAGIARLAMQCSTQHTTLIRKPSLNSHLWLPSQCTLSATEYSILLINITVNAM